MWEFEIVGFIPGWRFRWLWLSFALALMVAGYAKSHVDQLYEAKDMFALEGVIDVVGRDRQLPERFWLSKRLVC